MSNHTPAQVAAWMLAQLQDGKYVYQESMASRIQTQFGEEFVYRNKNGHPAVAAGVLKEFRKLSSDSVVWEGGMRAWRLRRTHDKPGRQQR